MKKDKSQTNRIPISLSLDHLLKAENIQPKIPHDKKRLLFISGLSNVVAMCVSIIAKLLIYLIDLITNISFFGVFSLSHWSPANNSLGWWVVCIPAIGGVVIGFMTLYGSKAIREVMVFRRRWSRS